MNTECTQAPVLSIITAAYNIEAFLPRCAESILRQTSSCWELLLVDDGSTDGTAAICDSLAARDPRIRVFHKPNGGLSDARNLALEVFRGDYVTFVDGDDFVSPEYAASLLRLMESGADMGVVTLQAFSDEGSGCRSREAQPVTLSSREAAEWLLLRKNGFSHSAAGKIYRRELWQELRFPVGRLYEDLLTTFRLLAQCRTAVFLDSGSYFYYQRPGSIMNSRVDARTLTLLDASDEAREQVVSVWPELARQADDLKAAAYLKSLQMILNQDPAGFPEVRKRIRRFCRSVRLPLVLSSAVPVKDKIKLCLTLLDDRTFLRIYNRFSG